MFQKEVAQRIVATPEERADLWPARGARQLALRDAHSLRRAGRSLHARRRRSYHPWSSSSRARCRYPATLRSFALSRKPPSGSAARCCAQSLKALGVDPLALLAEARIEPTKRAEEIDIAGFVALARALEEQRAEAEDHPRA